MSALPSHDGANTKQAILQTNLSNQGLGGNAAVAAAYRAVLRVGAGAEAAWEAARAERINELTLQLERVSGPEYKAYRADDNAQQAKAIREVIERVTSIPNPLAAQALQVAA